MSENHNVNLPPKQQQMLEHIQRAKQLGQSLSDYARQHGVNKKALYNYHWLLRKKGLLETPTDTPLFVKVNTKPKPHAVRGVNCRIVFPNGIQIEVHEQSITDLSGLLQQVQSL